MSICIFLSLSWSPGMVAQRICDAELKKELSTVWPNLSQKTMDLLVTPHKRMKCFKTNVFACLPFWHSGVRISSKYLCPSLQPSCPDKTGDVFFQNALKKIFNKVNDFTSISISSVEGAEVNYGNNSSSNEHFDSVIPSPSSFFWLYIMNVATPLPNLLET